MEEILNILAEISPHVISITACLIAYFKGQKRILTAEEIEKKEEAKKQKRIQKQYKKNKITPKKTNNEVINESVITDNENMGQIKIPKVGE